MEQQLLCLEGKNFDVFGSCQRGIVVDPRAFEKECDRCSEGPERKGVISEELPESEVYMLELYMFGGLANDCETLRNTRTQTKNLCPLSTQQLKDLSGELTSFLGRL